MKFINNIVAGALAVLATVSFVVTPVKATANEYMGNYGYYQGGNQCCPPPCDPCCAPTCDPCCPPPCCPAPCASSNCNWWCIAGGLLAGAAAGAGVAAAMDNKGKRGHDGRRGPTGDPGPVGPTGPGIPPLPAGTFLETFVVDGANTLAFVFTYVGGTVGAGATITPFVVLPNNVVVEGNPVAFATGAQVIAQTLTVPAIFGDYTPGVFLSSPTAASTLVSGLFEVTASRDGTITNVASPGVATTGTDIQAESTSGFAYGAPPIP